MKVSDVIQLLEQLAPPVYAEDFDNVGLLVGDKNAKIEGILVTLDTLESVVEEAIDNECNLIVSFHPIIFKGLKRLNGSSYVDRVVMQAIKNDIAIYAIHTALDNADKGVNSIICDVLGLKEKKILIPQKQTIKKLTTYLPHSDAEKLRSALFKVGAGSIGNYDQCSFNSQGIGTYRGNDDSNPTKGLKGQQHHEPETMVSVTYPKHVERALLKTLFETHPYEEVAYEIVSLENTNQSIGMGMIGQLPEAMPVQVFLNFVKEKMNASIIRHSALVKKSVQKVAVLGGSGSFAIPAAIAAGADVLMTADLKYHDFFSADGHIVLADIGHYESEQFTKNFLVDYLSKKIINFAPALSTGRVILSTTETNPVKYL